MEHGNLTVACVFWRGRFRHRPYTFKWVRKLKNMVDRNLAIPHTFACLTNKKEESPETDGIRIIPLLHDFPGWWSKIELFRPGIFPEGKVLYLDLDVLVMKDLSPLVNYDSSFCLVRTGDGHHRFESKIGECIKCYNSSVMLFDPEKYTKLYMQFRHRDMERFRGDQDYIASQSKSYDGWPKNWVVKMRDIPGRGHEIPPKKIKIVLSMPYKNQVAKKKFPWVKSVWR